VKSLLCFIALALGFLNSCQSPIPSGTSGSSQPGDRFLGVWKLDDSKRPRIRSLYGIAEFITIDRQGSRVIFAYRYSDNSLSWFVTDMKGDAVNVEASDKKHPPYPPQIAVTRKDSNTFVQDTGIGHTEFTVSADGHTMSVRRDLYVDYDPERVFVFDRVR
jgi:hypothetical protein